MTTSIDSLLDGSLVIEQPRKGHRIGTDAVLLAAACPPDAARIADLGCGVGAVGLRAAQTTPAAEVALIDNDAEILRLANSNITRNGLDKRVTTIEDDVFGKTFASTTTRNGRFDVVLTNPPFASPGQQRVSPVAGKARAHVLTGTLDGWIKAAGAVLAPKGRIVVIHRADTLAALIAALHRRFGGLTVLPIHPRADVPAHRILISGRLGSRAPLTLLAPLILHGADGAFTPEADALHRGAGRLLIDQQTR